MVKNDLGSMKFSGFSQPAWENNLNIGKDLLEIVFPFAALKYTNGKEQSFT